MATEKQYAKVRALLAKANSTTFPGEARVFRAKAEELIKKYGLDEARVNQKKSERPSWSVRDDWLKDFMKRREQEISKDLRREAGGRYSHHQMMRAAQMRRDGLTFKVIGLTLGIKATAHLAKTLREYGYLEDGE